MEPIVGSRAAMFNTRVYAAVRDHTEIKETQTTHAFFCIPEAAV